MGEVKRGKVKNFKLGEGLGSLVKLIGFWSEVVQFCVQMVFCTAPLEVFFFFFVLFLFGGLMFIFYFILILILILILTIIIFLFPFLFPLFF